MVATELANLLLERADSSAQLRPAQLSSPSHVTSQPTIDYVCACAWHFSAPPPPAGVPSPPPRPLARPLVFSLVCPLVSLRTQRSGRCARFGRVLPQIDTKRVVEIVLSVAPLPPSRPRAGRTRTWTTRTPAARISTARAANSARLGSSWLCLVQARTIWSTFCPKSTRNEWLKSH
jgi:hypothetical protein